MMFKKGERIVYRGNSHPHLVGKVALVTLDCLPGDQYVNVQWKKGAGLNIRGEIIPQSNGPYLLGGFVREPVKGSGTAG